MSNIRPSRYQLNLERSLSEALEREDKLAKEVDALKEERKELRKQLKEKEDE